MNTKNLKKSFDILDTSTHHYPRNKVIGELNLIVDRIKFSPELEDYFISCPANDTKASETIVFLFKSEVSEQIFDFLIALEEKGLLKTLIGDSGKEFIDYCQNILYQIKEVMFTSVVNLSKEAEDLVAAKIETVYAGQDVRIIFDNNPYLVAGFVIQDDNDLFDYSFKTNLTYNLRIYFKNKLEAIR